MSRGSAISPGDIDHVLDQGSDLWSGLQGARLFITGGSGFIGKWLIETALAANARRRLGLKIVALTRDATSFRQHAPWITEASEVDLVEGDVRTFSFPPGSFSHVIHAASDLALTTEPLLVHDIIVAGTRRVLDFAVDRGALDLLLVSSGAVYGSQPADVEHLEEDYLGSPSLTEPRQAYGQGKREAEWLGHAYAAAYGLRCRVVRPFALTGPYLPLDVGYAAASFIADLLAGRPISVTGDGMALRTYLYASDMAIWFWTVLLKGTPGLVCNVGGAKVVSMAELAALVAGIATPRLPVHFARTIATPARAAHRYVPSIVRARQVLGLVPTVLLEDGLRRMANSFRSAAAGRHILA